MPFEHEIDVQRRLIKVRAWDVITGADMRTAQKKYRSDPAFNPDFFQLYDFREVIKVAVAGDEVRDIATTSAFNPNSRRAIVAPLAVVYGFSRMFATYREISGGEEQIEVFESIEEAEEWLGLSVSRSRTAKDSK